MPAVLLVHLAAMSLSGLAIPVPAKEGMSFSMPAEVLVPTVAILPLRAEVVLVALAGQFRLARAESVVFH
jgi:hypothetical protein